MFLLGVRGNREMEKAKKFQVIAICLASILLIVGIWGLQKYNYIINPHKVFERALKQQQDLQLQKELHKQKESQKHQKQIEDSNKTSSLENPVIKKNVLNILLLGVDSSQIRESQKMGYRSDSIIIISVNLDTKKVKMLSVPRDSYTVVPGNKNKDKINHAMAFGGGPKKEGNQYAVQAVEGLLGINIHYYATVDMDVVKDIVDAIGGVTIDVERDMYSGGNKTLEKGEQKLNGDQALIYLRNRNTPTGDFARIEQQQKFMVALFQQTKENGKLSDIFPLYLKMKDNIFTDLKIDQIGALVLLLKDIEPDNIEAFALKGKGIRIKGIYYLEIDRKYMKKIMNEYFLDV